MDKQTLSKNLKFFCNMRRINELWLRGLFLLFMESRQFRLEFWDFELFGLLWLLSWSGRPLLEPHRFVTFEKFSVLEDALMFAEILSAL